MFENTELRRFFVPEKNQENEGWRNCTRCGSDMKGFQ
jgi:hypothetical protein